MSCRLILIPLLVLMVFFNCKETNPYANYNWHAIEVTATAYNSLSNQTDGDPYITAFGDSLISGLPYIAVSRDLLKKGLTYNTPVKIEGFDSLYFVKDKMHYRWKNHIDIYMGLNVKAAKEWGRKRIKIFYGIPKGKQ